MNRTIHKIDQIIERLQQLDSTISLETLREELATEVTRLKEMEHFNFQLYEVMSALTETMTFQEVMDVIFEKVINLLAGFSGVLSLLSLDGQYLEIVREYGVPPSVQEKHKRVPIEQDTPMNICVRTGTALWIENLEQYNARFPEFYETTQKHTGTQAFACIPLMIHHQAIGMLGFGFLSPTRFPDNLRLFLLSVANHCAKTLERVRLLNEIQTKSADVEHLYEITSALAKSVFLDDVLSIVTEGGKNVMGSESGLVGLISEDGSHLEIIRNFGFSNAVIEDYRRIPLSTEAPAVVAARKGVAVWVENPQQFEQQFPEFYQAIAEITGAKAVACIPLMTITRVIGVMGFGFSQPVSFSAKERSFLTSFANHCAKALERAQLVENIRQQAEQIHRKNYELQQFASIASHDLQEPLRKIHHFVERLDLLLRNRITDQEQDYLNRTLSATRRMQDLITNLLHYSSVMTHTHQIQTVELQEVVKNVLQDLELVIQNHQAHIIIQDLPTIEGDRVQIAQVFLNLISNALKFHDPQIPPQIRITGTRDATTGFVVIADNGIGFEITQAEKIFLPFHRLHGRSRYEGSGMGLAIVRRIVEQHGGTITAESTPGKGSTFMVTLPLRQTMVSTAQKRTTGFHKTVSKVES